MSEPDKALVDAVVPVGGYWEVMAQALIVWMDAFAASGRGDFVPSPSTAKWDEYSDKEQAAARLAVRSMAKAMNSAGYSIVRKEPLNRLIASLRAAKP